MKKPTSEIGRRPAKGAAQWVKAGRHSTGSGPAPKSDRYTARLTIDVTPAQRSRLKIAAIQRGVTVSEMLRTWLEQVWLAPDSPGDEDTP